MKYLMQRLKEPSTWQGIITIVTGLGVTLSPELAGAIVAVGAAVFGLASVIIKERAAADAQ